MTFRIRIAMVILVSAGIAIRSYSLAARSLWFDEAFSWRLIQFPFVEMMTRIAADVHPPLYYLVLRSYASLGGTSVFSLRFFSVLIAGVSIFLTYALVYRVTRDSFASILASALVTFSGWQIAFSWEARMYTLGISLSLLSSILILRALDRHSVWRWVMYGASAAAFAYVHYFSFFSIAAHVLMVCILVLHKSGFQPGKIVHHAYVRYGSLALVVGLLLYAPWVPTFLQQHSQVQESFWVPDIGGWSIPDTAYRMLIPTAGVPSHEGLGAVISTIPLGIILGLWIWMIYRYRALGAGGLVILLSGVMPFLIAIIVSFIGQSLYQDRFLAFAHAYILITLACAIARVPNPAVRRAGSLVLVLIFIALYVSFWKELAIQMKGGSHAASRYVFERAMKDDVVLVSSPLVYFSVAHYQSEEFSMATVPHLFTASENLLHFAGGPIITKPDVMTSEQLQNSQPSVVWMIDTTGFGGSYGNLPSEYKQVRESLFQEVFPHQGDVIVRMYARSLDHVRGVREAY